MKTLNWKESLSTYMAKVLEDELTPNVIKEAILKPIRAVIRL